MTSIVGCADTFPKGESKYLYRRLSRHFPQGGKQMTSIVGRADTFPERENERRECSLFL